MVFTCLLYYEFPQSRKYKLLEKISCFVDIRDTGQKCAIIAVSQLEKSWKNSRGKCKWGIIILQIAALPKSNACAPAGTIDVGMEGKWRKTVTGKQAL